MSTEKNRPAAGTIGWIDLTIPDAPQLRSFYEAVVGWRSEEVSMGEYSDYSMVPTGSDDAVAGVCHARGSNAGQPGCWMIYVNVDDLDASLKACVDLGGKIVRDIRSMGPMGRYAVIEDPSGASMSLFEPAG